MANKGRNPNTDEISLWQKMTQGIKAWQNAPASTDSKSVVQTNKDKGRKTDSPLLDASLNITKKPVQRLGGTNGLDRRTKDKLNKGKMRIEARIDLHGKTQSQAQTDLISFITGAYNARKRCVLVVTGKGSRDIEDTGLVSERSHRGILRARLPEWIYAPPLGAMVLSHSTATSRDGGSGAFYVYLKNKNKN